MFGSESSDNNAQARDKKLLEDCLKELQSCFFTIHLDIMSTFNKHHFFFWTRPKDYDLYYRERDTLYPSLIKPWSQALITSTGVFIILRLGGSRFWQSVYRQYFTREGALDRLRAQKAVVDSKKHNLESPMEWKSYMDRKREERMEEIANHQFIRDSWIVNQILGKRSEVTKKTHLDKSVHYLLAGVVGAITFFHHLFHTPLYPVLSQAPLQPGYSLVHKMTCPVLQQYLNKLSQKHGIDFSSDKIRMYAERDAKAKKPLDPDQLLRTTHSLYKNCQLRSKYVDQTTPSLSGNKDEIPVPYPGIRGQDW